MNIGGCRFPSLHLCLHHIEQAHADGDMDDAEFAAFEAAGIACARDPSELGQVLLESLKAAGLR